MGPSTLQTFIAQAIQAAGYSTNQPIQIDMPAKSENGDWSCNLAMILAKQQKLNPRHIANAIVEQLKTYQMQGIADIQIAGPGFINFWLDTNGKQAVLNDCIHSDNYGFVADNGARALVEFVSANPTGPLHVGHARGAVVGDVLANLLMSQGYQVDREYYVNDYGTQVDTLVASVLYYLWQQQKTMDKSMYGLYQGGYVADVVAAMSFETVDLPAVFSTFDAAESILPSDDEQTQNNNLRKLIDALLAVLNPTVWAELKRLSIAIIVADIKRDLVAFNVKHNQWQSEAELQQNENLLGDYLDQLKSYKVDGNSVIEQEGKKIWFLSDKLGDDKPRVIVKENGDNTYFASDLIYHAQKFDRGYKKIINIWGIDHHGYIARMKAAMQALGRDSNDLIVILTQLVNLMSDGEKMAMSKRKGTYVTLRELMLSVPADAARVMFLTRAASAPLDFDIKKAIAMNNENPLFYMQYAHARACSLLQKGADYTSTDSDCAAEYLLEPADHELIRAIAKWPMDLQKAADAMHPHQVFTQTYNFAALFHSWYGKVTVIGPKTDQTKARLVLTNACAKVLRTGLAVMGVDAPQSM